MKFNNKEKFMKCNISTILWDKEEILQLWLLDCNRKYIKAICLDNIFTLFKYKYQILVIFYKIFI